MIQSPAKSSLSFRRRLSARVKQRTETTMSKTFMVEFANIKGSNGWLSRNQMRWLSRDQMRCWKCGHRWRCEIPEEKKLGRLTHLEQSSTHYLIIGSPACLLRITRFADCFSFGEHIDRQDKIDPNQPIIGFWRVFAWLTYVNTTVSVMTIRMLVCMLVVPSDIGWLMKRNTAFIPSR